MTQRVLVKGAEAALPVNVGTASTFLGATVIRLVNTASGADHLITVADAVGGSTVGSFTLMRGTVEFLEKKPTEAVFAANAAVKGAKVGFTG
tara:strand:- start:253 stop:528 length:276 start_codon:yes stop_codon:yes gene_type:complete